MTLAAMDEGFCQRWRAQGRHIGVPNLASRRNRVTPPVWADDSLANCDTIALPWERVTADIRKVAAQRIRQYGLVSLQADDMTQDAIVTMLTPRTKPFKHGLHAIRYALFVMRKRCLDALARISMEAEHAPMLAVEEGTDPDREEVKSEARNIVHRIAAALSITPEGMEAILESDAGARDGVLKNQRRRIRRKAQEIVKGQ